MKKTKKILSLAIASILTVISFSGCGSSNQSSEAVNSKGGSEKTVTLRMWGGVPPEAGPQKACDNFNELYKDKGIQVEYERYVNDETGNLKLETNLLSGNGVDLYMTYSADVLTKRADANMALDLTELCEKDAFDINQYFGDMAKSYYVNGKPYSIPTKLDQFGIVLNKTMFEEAGIEIPTEWTYDEFMEIAKKLTKGEGQDKTYGMFWNTQQDPTGFTYSLCQTLGGDPFYKSETETNFTSPEFIKSVDLINKMMNVDGTSPTHTDSVTQKLSQESMFLTGKSAMTIGSWMIRNIKNVQEYPHDFETAFAPYPVVEKGQRNYTQGGYGDFLCINPKSENIDAAWTFLQWYSTEGMLPVVEGGRVPASNTYEPEEIVQAFIKGSEKYLDSETTMNVLIKPANNYAVPKITNKLPEIKKVLHEELEGIYTGNQTSEEGMKKAKERADELLKN